MTCGKKGRIKTETIEKTTYYAVKHRSKKECEGKKEKFVDNGDGTIKDNKTGLIWKKCSEGQNDDANCSGEARKYDWEEANTICKKSYWRLPTKEELMSLIKCSKGFKKDKEDGCKEGSIKPTIYAQKFQNTFDYSYWSSSIDVDGNSIAWNINFDNGNAHLSFKTDRYYVRCVRGL